MMRRFLRKPATEPPRTITVTQTFRGIPSSAVHEDEDGRTFVWCPHCGRKLLVLQHPTTLGGRRYIACASECPDPGPFVILEETT